MEQILSGVPGAVAQGAAWCWALQQWDSLLAKSAVKDVPSAGPQLREKPPAQEPSRKAPARLEQQLHGISELLPVVLIFSRNIPLKGLISFL